MEKQFADYRNVVIKKPWGEEYLCYQNEELAIWLLHIKKGYKTSFHCHPNKNTGFIVLGGNVRLSFMRNEVLLNPLDKIHIFRARFHSTEALSDGGAYVMEVETPEDKRDLVRMDDEYGRQGQSYEGAEHEMPKSASCVWIDEPEAARQLSIAQSKLIHVKPDNKEELLGFPATTSFIVSRGGVNAGKLQQLLFPGDIIDGASLQKLLQSFHLIDGSTFIKVNG